MKDAFICKLYKCIDCKVFCEPFSTLEKTALEETVPRNWFRDYSFVYFNAQKIADELITKMKDLVLNNSDYFWANGKRKAQELGIVAVTAT